jgi:uncharacterized YigZ family protein
VTDDPDRYVIPASRAQAELVVQRSRFIAVAAPVADVMEAQAVVEAEQKRFHDATHHCFAWKVEGGERSADAGEPSGTAGKPILSAITRAGCEDAVVVVTRYFGGVKLGPGGLARAYGEAAAQALALAGRRELFRTGRWLVTFDFDHTSQVHHAVSRFEARTLESNYSQRASLLLELRRSRLEAFRATVLEATSGRAEFQHG